MMDTYLTPYPKLYVRLPEIAFVSTEKSGEGTVWHKTLYI